MLKKTLMKNGTLKLLFGLLFIGFSPSMTAQNTFDVGTQWYYQEPATSFWGFVHTKMEIVGDTIIAGQACSILEGGCSCSVISSKYIYKTGEQVFYYNEETSGFSLLYDFAAMPGDTLSIDLTDLTDLSTVQVIIDSLGQITAADGVVHQVQYYHSWHPDWGNNVIEWGSYLIKDIGSVWCFFPSSPLCSSSIGPLRCYINDVQNIDYHFESAWFDIDFPCDTNVMLVATEEITLAEKMTIYPNPVSNVLTINMPDLAVQEKEISILDINGKLVTVKKSKGKTIAINTSNLVAGLYYVKVVSQGFTQMKPFVKMN